MNKEELMAIVAKAEAEKRNLTDEEKQMIADVIETRAAEETPKEEPASGETEEQKACEEPKKEEEERAIEEPASEETPTSGETEEERACEDKPEDEKRNLNNKVINNNKMEKNFFLKELRSAAQTGKRINLAEVEARAYTVAAEGDDVVKTEIFDIWKPLRAGNKLVAAGAKTITGIKDNIQIPLMGKCQAYFASETGAAQDGSGVFTSKKLSPRRITARYPISLQLLTQDNDGVEAAIMEEISNAVYAKLEETLLGVGAGDDDTPESIFHALSATTANSGNTINNFGDVCAMEAKIEDVNVAGEPVYVMSNKAKAALRNMAKSAKSTELVYQNGQVDGTVAYNTSNIAGKGFLYGDFSNLVIAAWDNVQIDVVRDTASVGNGVVTIVINCFVDAKLVRPEGLVAGYIA